MSVDYLVGIPDTITDHAHQYLNSPDIAVQGAYLTGTIIGQAEGKQALYQALDADAQSRAESFVESLGPRPEYRWDKAEEAPETLTGDWLPKPAPVVDCAGPWPVVVPPTHEAVPLAVAA